MDENSCEIILKIVFRLFSETRFKEYASPTSETQKHKKHKKHRNTETETQNTETQKHDYPL